MKHTIAIVDDEVNILTSVSIALEEAGYIIQKYSDSTKVLEDFEKHPVDLAVFDVKMPGLDGMELLQELRKTSAIPVIFLTSKDAEIDELLGFKMGADDYITKPFSQNLLIERIKALLRRVKITQDTSNKNEEEIIHKGHLVLDVSRHLCLWRDRHLALTVTEFLLLKALSTRPGHVKSRDQLMNAAYGDSIYVDDRTIDSHIKRVRQKFKKADDGFDRIETLYGVGYRYKDD